MNKTQQLLKSREEEYDKGFDALFGVGWRINSESVRKYSKSFHATTISLLLNSLKEEINYYRGLAVFGNNDEKVEPYEMAFDDISTFLSETISNIQTK